MNLDKVRQLASASEECVDFWNRAIKWVIDPTAYESRSGPTAMKTARFSIKDVDKMLEVGKIKIIAEHEIRAWVRAFPVPEPAKMRRRPIFAPDLNDWCGKDTLQCLRMPAKAEIRQQCLDGTKAYLFDFASYYDQFRMRGAIPKYFGMRAKDGRFFCLQNLAMGQRQAVEAAQATTWRLLDFPMGVNVRVATCIDNVRFVGPAEETEAAVRTFLARCKAVGATLNELDLRSFDPTKDDVEIFASSASVFLGEDYDYVVKSVRCAAKTVEKTGASWKRRSSWSAKNFAAHFGLLFFASNVLGVKLAKYFEALRYFRTFSKAITLGETTWSGRAPPLSDAAWKELGRWTDEVLANTARILTPLREAQEPDYVLITDASAKMWGALSVSVETGHVLEYSGKWPDHLLEQMKSSVAAEPEGIWLAMCRFFSPNSGARVLILTDHSPAVWPAEKGYAKGFFANRLYRRLETTFPMCQISFLHIKGENNPTDGISRGLALSADDREKAVGLARSAEDREVLRCSTISPSCTPHNKRPDFMR